MSEINFGKEIYLESLEIKTNLDAILNILFNSEWKLSEDYSIGIQDKILRDYLEDIFIIEVIKTVCKCPKDSTGKSLHPIKRKIVDNIEYIIPMNCPEKKYFEAIEPTTKMKPKIGNFVLDTYNGDNPHYIKILYLIDGCYEFHIYDACAVLLRRLIETLIIDIYKTRGKLEDLKTKKNNFLKLDKIISIICDNPDISLSKTAKQTLNEIKSLGDTAAHNRKITLDKNDLDIHTSSLRTTLKELFVFIN